MKVFGLTGGIGMGKSTADQWLRPQGMPVVDTDILARQVVEPGQPALAEIIEAFGKDVLVEGRLSREQLAGKVFADPTALKKLESITHPRILELWRVQIESWRAENHRLAVVVIPLLFETGAEIYFHKTICVACSGASQMQRLQARGWTPEQTRQRIAAQWSVEKKMNRADFVVWSEGELDLLGRQLGQILIR